MGKLKKILYAIIVLFLFFSLTKNIFDYKNALTFYKGYQKDYEKEKKDNATFRTHILKYKDPHELEKTIRNKLNMLKQDEIAVILPKPTPVRTGPPPTSAPVYRQWLTLLLGN